MAFHIQTEPLQRSELAGERFAGSRVVFEGLVRPDQVNGIEVAALFYEAHPTLAEIAGNAVLEEARSRFQLQDVSCAHRIGQVNVGEPSIMVECQSAHRLESFEAVKWIMDEIKRCVPIWKQEILADGSKVWLAPKQPPSEVELYARQTRLKEVGEAGQSRLKAAKVAIVGAGGVGCLVARLLSGAGVGEITLIDGDVVSAPDLHRQVLFDIDDLGKPKVFRLASKLQGSNPHVKVHPVQQTLDRHNAMELLGGLNLVIDAVDTFSGKLAINDACQQLGISGLHCALSQWQGQMMRIEPGSACLRCLWREAPVDGCVENCAEAGILGPLSNLVATLAAQESLKILLGLKSSLKPGVLVLVDSEELSLRKLKVERSLNCPDHCEFVDSTPDLLPLEVDQGQAFIGFHWVDIREESERAFLSIGGPMVVNIPMGQLSVDNLPSGKVLLVCSKGIRSKAMAEIMRREGRSDVFSLAGGLEALAPKKQ